MDLLDYARTNQHITFENKPLNTVDLAILNEINYLVFKGIIPANKDIQSGLNLRQVYDNYLVSDTPKEHELFFSHDTRLELLRLIANSHRYEKAISFGHEDIFDETTETQFSVTSFMIADTIAIIFRGTDSSIIGWKEDFNLSYLEAIPSQTLAKNYLLDMEKRYDIPLILSGHSKGGNLALYAASQTTSPDKIVKLYIFDAPGLQADNLTLLEEKELSPKIHAYKPQTSLVGILFHHTAPATTIKSDGLGAMQHLLLLWKVDINRDDFVLAPQPSKFSQKLEQISSNYLDNSPSKVNERSLNLLFKALFSNEAGRTLKERLFVAVKIIHQANQAEKKALIYASKQFFAALTQDNHHYQEKEIKDFRSRQTFLSFFSLPEQIAYRSKWLALFISIIFAYTVWIFYHYPHLILIVFGSVYSLAILMSFVLTLKAWIKSKNKLHYEFLPGFFSIASLGVIIFNKNILALLPILLTKSLVVFILIWTGHFIIQSYKARKHLPQISRALSSTAIVTLLIAGMLYQFSTVAHFFIERAILLLLFYKCIKLFIITFRKFR